MTAPPEPRALRVIAGFKLVQAALFVATGIGLLRLLEPSVAEQVQAWVLALPFDKEHEIVDRVVEWLSGENRGRIGALGIVVFAYAALFLTEGIGLWLGKRWAEILTVLATGSLIPVELWETVRNPGPIKLTILTLNVAIVIYLARHVWQERAHAPAPGGGPGG